MRPTLEVLRYIALLYMVCLPWFQLKPVEFLLGSTAKLGEIIVLGMLTQMKEVRNKTQMLYELAVKSLI